MDKLNLILESEKELINKEIQEIERIIERTGYCEIVRMFGKNEFNIELSYPKYFSESNAFLINSSEECFKIQEDFVKLLKNNSLTCNLKIRIVGVTVPFIYLMDSEEDICTYKNVFKILEEVYMKRNLTLGSEKNMLISERYGRIIFSDRSYDREYYQQVIISSHFKNLKYEYNQNTFENICEEFPNLEKRMRFEYSVNISKDREIGKVMTLDEFRNFNVFGVFVNKAIDYILENLLNEESIESVIEEKTDELTDKLYDEITRRKPDYERLFYKYIDLILDYQIVRKALNQIRNPKTRERAVTIIRKLIFKNEIRERVIIFNTCEKIQSMIKLFKNL